MLQAAGPDTSAGAAGLSVLFGAVHGVLVAAMMPVMLSMAHPLVRNGTMSAPGVAMTGMGKMTPMGIVMAHVVFGVVSGVIYVGIVG